MRKTTGFREQRTNFITYALDSIGLTYRLTVTPQHTALGHPSKEDYVEFDTVLLHLPSDSRSNALQERPRRWLRLMWT